jgi:hypothetical protein
VKLRHLLMIAATAIVLMAAGMAQADTWNLGNDFYTGTQHTPWLYGALNTDYNYFALFDGQSNVSNGHGGTFAGWLSAGEGWDAYGSLGKNLGPGVCDAYGFYTELGGLRIQGADYGNWIPGTLWRAPADGQYLVTARFTGTWYADATPATYPDHVYVKEGNIYTYSNLATADITGFIGTAAAGYADGWGDVREYTYSGTRTLTAGEDLLFLARGDASYGHCIGLEVTITAVPEPTGLALVVTGFVGLLAYAWRKRK